MSIDWPSIQSEAVNHLQNLLRINTTNPPGNEIEGVKYLSAILKKADIPFWIFEPAPGRGNLVARLKGLGGKRPLLLTSHLDVVPAEASFWKVDPFSGDIHEGCVWGRGAVDMKQMTVMGLMMLLMAKRGAMPFSRDLIFSVFADEEAGCFWGSQWIVANKPDLIDSEYALNEVGGFSLYLDGVDEKVFYPIGVAERGLCWLKLSCEGEAGHGSMPHDCQAIVKMAAAVCALGAGRFPFHKHPLVTNFIEKMARHLPPPKRWILKLLLVPGLNRFVLHTLVPKKKVRQFQTMLANTASPTVFKGGEKVNVIPSTAELLVDGRILPGQSVKTFLRELEKIIGSGLKREIVAQHEPTEMDYENEFYQILAKNIVKHDKKGVPVPYLIPGFTDAAYLSRLGIKCYGFAPVKLNRDTPFSEMFHGHNERIPVEGFLFGLKVLWDVVLESC